MELTDATITLVACIALGPVATLAAVAGYISHRKGTDHE